ncbi:hypothetical protein RCL1_001985 [Eukaryota sp. TZLM3-RCL]
MINELHKTCKSVGVVSQREPFLSLLSSNMSKWSSKSRGDLHLNWLKSKQLIIDATTVFFKSQSNLKVLKESADDNLKHSENLKIRKYNSIINDLNAKSHVKIDFIPLAMSLCGRLSSTGERFFLDFQEMVRSGQRSYFSIHLHKIKYVFALYNRFSTFLKTIALKLAAGTEKNQEDRTIF